MKKHLLLLVIFAIPITAQLNAASVTVSDAQTVALNFFKMKVGNTARAIPQANLVFTQTEADNTIDFYVFDCSPAKGFVIVAADDNVIPILAYSTESNFNANFNRIGIRSWMHKTSANIHLALQNHVIADMRISSRWSACRQGINPGSTKSTVVAPLCTTTWDQENDVTAPPPYLYNLLCPYNSTDQQRCLTGCVATAQAQIMKYWNYPASGTGSFTYTDDVADGYSYDYGTLTANFAHSYQWPLMPSVLTGNEPLAQDSAIDVLMYDCCVSVGMDFGDDNQDGSGANALIAEELQFGDSNCSQHALVKYFSYNADTILGVFESSNSAASWTNLIEHDLNVGRPVLYEGDDATQGGHAWVCDGYDADDNLHMNWGWSGFDNGYFAINNLTTAGNFDPIQDDDALIGILPKYPLAPITNYTASLTNSCNGTVQFTDFSQDLPTSWLWNFGDGTTSTQQSPSHTYAANGTYSVTLTAANPAGSTPKTITNYITINMLSAPTVSNVSAAGPQSFSLTAGTSTTVAWFDANGTLVSTSNPFVTPVLNSTTVYYVEDSVISPSTHLGPADNQIGAGGYLTDPYNMQFTALSPCLIQSIYVYAQTAGERTFQVFDSTGNVVAQTTVYVASGGVSAAVNFSLDAGGPYFMAVGDTLGLYSNTAGGNYPYSDSLGLISITGNTAYDLNMYYYFYDWVVSAPHCISPRATVTASIATGIEDLSHALSFSLLPNPASNDVLLQTAEKGDGLSVSIKNIIGQTLVSQSIEAPQTHLDLNKFSNGVYLVELRQGEKSAVNKLVISR